MLQCFDSTIRDSIVVI